jgi:hypothetical protein
VTHLPKVLLYSKPGCHLCDIVEQTIRFVRTQRPFDFEKCNIELTPDEFERYKHDIPVIMVDGAEISRHTLTAAALNAALDSALTK